MLGDLRPMIREVMGGLELNRGDGWKPVSAGRLVLAGLNGLAVPMPSVDDQIRILQSFGRDKDLARARLLALLLPLPAKERTEVAGGRSQ